MEDRLFRLTDTDTRPASQKVIYRYWGNRTRWTPTEREILRVQSFRNFNYSSDSADMALLSSIVDYYNVSLSSSSWQTEVTIYSDNHFEIHMPQFDLRYANPVNFDEAQAYLFAAEVLAKLGLLPDLHTVSIYAVLREDINSTANLIESIEFDVVISPALRGHRLYNGNEITVRISEFGVTDIFYKWYDISFVNEIEAFMPFNRGFVFDMALPDNLAINTASHVYFLDSYNNLRMAFEIIDDAGFVVALVDAVTGELVDRFH